MTTDNKRDPNDVLAEFDAMKLGDICQWYLMRDLASALRDALAALENWKQRSREHEDICHDVITERDALRAENERLQKRYADQVEEQLELLALLRRTEVELTALRHVADAAQALIDEKVNRSGFNMDHRSLDSRLLSALRALPASTEEQP